MLNQFAFCSVFLPLLAFVLTCFLSTSSKNKYAPWVCTLLMGGSFLCAILITFLLNFGPVHEIKLFTWVKVENLKINWGIYIDALSLTMICVVNFVSLLVHVYSFGYMNHDKNIGKFFSLLSLFTFFMLILVCAPNMMQLFFGWEGVGLASYLLIGFWYEKEAPPAAAMKAFIVNRVGDIGLIAALGLLFFSYETLEFNEIFSQLKLQVPSTVNFFGGVPTFELIACALILGAMGKSAQFGLHTWLPDAMEGPTPVSALIHAATMVTAGVFLLCRFSFLIELAPFAKSLLLIIGTITCFFAASVATTQTDIKRIIAYSTCSQLGYMMMACGVSAYSSAIFHLVTHAFFKALLFLGAGSVIHAMSSEQNIFKMGGLLRLIPFTFSMMMIGSLALAGIPFFAGFYSKDAILHMIYEHENGNIAFIVGLLVVFLTAFYSFRLMILTFNHTMRNDEHVEAHVHESPLSMRIPLVLLAIGAIFSGVIGNLWYLHESFGFKWGNAIFQEVSAPMSHSFLTQHIPYLIATVGIAFAYAIYMGQSACSDKIAATFNKLYTFLYNKWYIDDFYEKFIVLPIQNIGRFFWRSGETFIDQAGPDGFAQGTLRLSKILSVLLTGQIQHMVASLAIILALILGAYLLLPYFHFIKG